MLVRLTMITILGFGIAFATPVDAKSKSPAATLKLFDTDNDGSIDLVEAKKAAGDLFDKLDTNKDNKITTKELQGRLSKKDLAANDPDKDNALTKDEYLALVEARFKAADAGNDGKIDAKELATPAGKDLVRLLK
jgi:Ca2+-binding EF-hand superfamily protein